jgi:hypothetical protein
MGHFVHSRGELLGTVAEIEMVWCVWVTGETPAMLLKERRRELVKLHLVSNERGAEPGDEIKGRQRG